VEPPKKPYARGQIIFMEGDSGDEMYLIAAGSVKITRLVGEKHVTLGIFGPNEFIGEMVLLGDARRSGTAIAMQDSELVVINRATFEEALRATPKWLGVVLRSLAERLYQMDQRLGKDLVYVGKKYPGTR
jgi:CRP-like cAMP-binding protein